MKITLIMTTLLYTNLIFAFSLNKLVPELEASAPAVMELESNVQYGSLYSIDLNKLVPEAQIERQEERPIYYYGDLGQENCEGVLKVEEYKPLNKQQTISVLSLEGSKRSKMSIFGCSQDNECIRISKGSRGSTSRPVITGNGKKKYLLSSFSSLIISINSISYANGCFIKLNLPSDQI